MTRLLTKTPTRMLTRLYVSTVVVVSLLTIGGQVLTQRSLARQANDGGIINVAGRQRMLSQKITKVALALSSAQISPERLQAASTELDAALTLFQKAHEGLQFGSAELGLPAANSPQVSALFAAIEPRYAAIIPAATQLSDRLKSGTQLNQSDNAAIRTIDDNEDPFLKGMNEIVNQYEKEANARIERLQVIQQILLGLTLLALLPVLVPIYHITRQINHIISKVQQSGLQVMTSSVQIAASGSQMETMAEEQAEASAKVTASSQAIAAGANHLNSHIKQVVDQAQTAQSIASAGAVELTTMASTMRQLDKMASDITAQLQTIRDRASNIDQVVLAMTKVADQTNLLSLNAAIEAEKAGEAGAGFSVVAREIRRLADQSAIATLEIETLVKDMQAAVATGVVEMEKFSQSVAKSSGGTALVANQVTAVIQQVQALLPQLTEMNQSITAQSLSAEQIHDAMAQLSLGSHQTVRALQETNGALALLRETAEGLQVSIPI
ncbi:MAG: methyl-accepting chemotaxis protein [Phormidesmis sp.]